METYLHTWLTYIHINLHLSALVSETNDGHYLVLQCSWFLRMSEDFIPNETFKEWNENHVLIPINVHNRHWLLVVL